MSNYPNSRWVEHLQFLEAKLETNVYEARIKMHEFVQEFPEGPYSAKANYNLGQLSELSGDYAEAQVFYLKVYDYFPSNELRDESMLKAARCMLLGGEAEAAHLRLEAYLADEPSRPWRRRAEELCADALFEAGALRLAQEKYKDIISESSAPEDVSPECYIKIAGIYDAEGNHKAALRAYRRFLKIFPNAVQRPAVERKMADLAFALRVNLSVNGRPHVIEAGLFESRQEAMRLVARLTRLGHQAYLVTRNIDKSYLVSVRLGPYASRDSALAVAERLYEEAGLEVTLMPQGG
jgi:TolA-binding protein